MHVHNVDDACCYQLVGDNVDLRVTPRHMTTKRRTGDYHWFHSFAVKHRITKGDICMTVTVTSYICQ